MAVLLMNDWISGAEIVKYEFARNFNRGKFGVLIVRSSLAHDLPISGMMG
jgi:hypothetical protein